MCSSIFSKQVSHLFSKMLFSLPLTPLIQEMLTLFKKGNFSSLKNRLAFLVQSPSITAALFHRKDSGLKDPCTFHMQKFLQSIFSPALFLMSTTGWSWQIGDGSPETEKEARSCFTGLIFRWTEIFSSGTRAGVFIICIDGVERSLQLFPDYTCVTLWVQFQQEKFWIDFCTHPPSKFSHLAAYYFHIRLQTLNLS